ncbi:hypothetical protein EQV77_08925 [Halobacillus fulvus]|nr:hypothetical protein EQV77_08925 [Halobacillus fulvus]
MRGFFMKSTWKWMLLLIGTIILVSGIVFYRVIEEGFYFIANGGDFRAQYIHYFNLFHELVRESGLPFWSWDYALGGSFWNDFGYYMLGDIFIWILLFFPKGWFPDLIIPMSILKLTLMGTGVFLLLKKVNIKPLLAVIGAISYTFAGYHFEFFYTHYFFVNLAVFLPFILLGFERFIQQKKAGLFVLFIFLASIGNFYFMFIASLGLGFYALYRYVTWTETKSVKGFFTFHLHWFLYYLIGLGLSMPIFLPSLLSLMNSNAPYRADVEQPYAFDFSETLIDSFNLLSLNGGISFLVLILLPVLFLHYKKCKPEVVFTLLLLLIIAFPPALEAVGGFSAYEEFRSYPVFHLLLTMTTIRVLQRMDRKETKTIIGIVFGTAVLTAGYLNAPPAHGLWVMIGLVALFAVIVMIYPYMKEGGWKYALQAAMLASVVGFGAMTANSLVTDLLIVSKGEETETAHEGAWGLISLMDEEDYRTLFHHSDIKESLASLEESDSFSRIQVESPYISHNSSMTYGYSSNLAYQTLLPWDVQRFELDVMAFSGGRNLNLNKGYLNYSYLDSLMANQYIVYPESEGPDNVNRYGYEKVRPGVFENENALPFGFVYHDVQSIDQLLDAPYGYRDRLMFEKAFIPTEKADEFDPSPLEQPGSVSVVGELDEASVSAHAEVEKRDDGWYISSEDTFTITIPIDDHERGQLIASMDYEPYTPTDGITLHASTDQYDGSLIYQKNMSRYSYQISQYHYTGTVDAVNFNFGIDESASQVTMNIQPGEFLIQDLKVYVDDFSNMENIVEEREERALMIEEFSNNKVKGTVETSEQGVLFLSMPFHEGWSAKLNGEEVDLYKVHSLYTGLTVPEGAHTVELSFTPTGLMPGVGIASAALILFITLRIYRRKK